MKSEKTPIAYMDGNCTLCSFGARAIDRLDKSGTIKICPIQTERGRTALIAHGLDPDDPDSWLFIDETGAYEGFDGMIRVGARSGGLGLILQPLRLVPRPIRNWLYRRIARNRYALFGRTDLCALPRPSLRARMVK